MGRRQATTPASAVLLLLLLHPAAADVAAAAPGTVVALDKTSFDDTVQPGQTWLLEFYAPWCGHCKRLNPILDDLAKQVYPELMIGKVDVTANRHLADDHGVKGFPTLRFFHSGEFYDYDGGRDFDALSDFARRITGDLVTDVDSREGVDALVRKGGDFVVVLGRAGGAAVDAAVRAQLEALAIKFQTRTAFGVVSDLGLIEAAGVADAAEAAGPGGHVLLVHEPGEAIRAAPAELFSAEEDAEAFAAKAEAWVKREMHQRVVKLEGVNFRQIAKTDKTLLIMAVDTEDYGAAKRAEAALADAARRATPEMENNFVFCHSNGPQFTAYYKRIGISIGAYPYLYAVSPNENSKVWVLPAAEGETPPTKFSADDVLAFAAGVVDGSVPVYSAPLMDRVKRFFEDAWENLTKGQGKMLLIPFGVISASLFGLWLDPPKDREEDEEKEEEEGEGEGKKDKKKKKGKKDTKKNQ